MSLVSSVLGGARLPLIPQQFVHYDLHALDLGMFPAIPAERFKQVGNAAGMGAKRALISTVQRSEASRIARTSHYVELAGSPVFNKNFIQAVQLGRYRLRDGKREEVD